MTGNNAQTTTAMWGGRFDEPPAELFKRFNDSLPIDWRMVQHDITASIAWAQELHAVSVLSETECERIIEGLRDVASHAATMLDPPIEGGLEDVHSWVEHELVERLGDLGKKLHTGRSRNDLVSTDLRLWTRACITERLRELAELRRSLLDIADKHVMLEVQDVNLVAVDDETYAYVTRYSEEELEAMQGVDEGFWN